MPGGEAGGMPKPRKGTREAARTRSESLPFALPLIKQLKPSIYSAAQDDDLLS